jgi:hypothetical protein
MVDLCEQSDSLLGSITAGNLTVLQLSPAQGRPEPYS